MKKGFTLVELLVVLVVIGILVGLILPNALRAIDQANRREAASTLKAIDTAVQLCYSTTRDWTECDTIGELTAPAVGDPYMDPLPSANAPHNGVAYALTAPLTAAQAGPNTGSIGSTGADFIAVFPNWPDINS